MNFIEAIKEKLNMTQTENGDLAHKTSGSACLDLFSLCGAMRRNIGDLNALFAKAYAENPILALKILFYMRNIRGGLGERNAFRVVLKNLADFYPKVARQVLYAVSEYGRWDDLLCLLQTSVKDDVLSIIKAQLEKDTAALEKGADVSLLGKWLPSVNASSKQTVKNATILMRALGMRAGEYRKLCTALRAKIKIIEDNLRRKDYTFDYSLQPSQAMLKYKKAFLRNDSERYTAFLQKVVANAGKKGDDGTKLNASTLYPYQIVAPFYYGSNLRALSEAESLPLEASWLSLNRSSFASKTIVVRDGSGSMYWTPNAEAATIATSLSLLFAEQLEGAFKNSFITFSAEPKLVQIPENADTLQKKLAFLSNYYDASNTDIAKVYQLILDIAKSRHVPKDEMIERVLIVSDMEFDCIGKNESTFDFYKRKFAAFGYKMPELVFWNVEARNVHLPVTQNEQGVKLVSGSSANIFADVLSGDLKVVTPYEFMLKMLEPYAEFDSVVA